MVGGQQGGKLEISGDFIPTVELVFPMTLEEVSFEGLGIHHLDELAGEGALAFERSDLPARLGFLLGSLSRVYLASALPSMTAVRPSHSKMTRLRAVGEASHLY